MKQTIILMMLVGVGLTGCVEESNSKGWDLNDPPTNNAPCGECTTPTPRPDEPITVPAESPELVGMFVSGHLGNYLDCPEEGYDAEAAAGGVSSEDGGFAGDCVDDGCGILNCETAQITIRLENIGTLAAKDLGVAQIEIFDVDGNLLAELPITAVTDVDSAEPAASELNAGGAVMLRVDFQGPARPWDFFDRTGDGAFGHSGTLHITVKASNHAPLVIESTELYTLDSIAT